LVSEASLLRRSYNPRESTPLPDNKLVDDMLVHDEIKISLSKSSFLVLQAIVQVGQHVQTGGKEGYLLRNNAQFSFLGLAWKRRGERRRRRRKRRRRKRRGEMRRRREERGSGGV